MTKDDYIVALRQHIIVQGVLIIDLDEEIVGNFEVDKKYEQNIIEVRNRTANLLRHPNSFEGES